ncbi:MAG: 3-keto-5-aminohexanoate cleavage protein [Geminicoccaceae bacterium]
MEWPPLVIACAPNGARRTKTDHPALPMTVAELIATGTAAAGAGASLLHYHVRDDDGMHSLDIGRNREAYQALRDALADKLVLQPTTEAQGRYSPDEQMALVRALEPESVSIALREMVPQDVDVQAATDFFAWAAEAGISCQIILYSAQDIRRLAELRDLGVLPQATVFSQLVLGRYNGTGMVHPRDLIGYLIAQDLNQPWSVCSFGEREAAVLAAAAALGGHIRVGFENTLNLADGSRADDNVALVRQAAQMARHIGRPVADVAYTRALIQETV